MFGKFWNYYFQTGSGLSQISKSQSSEWCILSSKDSLLFVKIYQSKSILRVTPLLHER